MSHFQMTFTANAAHIDELGHVNNSVWVQWIQEVATAHWLAVASPEHVAAHVWVVTRHEIDYRGNIGLSESVSAETSIPAPPRGAQFDRDVVFRDVRGKAIVTARSTWALLDRATGRLCRVRPELAAPFYAA